MLLFLGWLLFVKKLRIVRVCIHNTSKKKRALLDHQSEIAKSFVNVCESAKKLTFRPFEICTVFNFQIFFVLTRLSLTSEVIIFLLVTLTKKVSPTLFATLCHHFNSFYFSPHRASCREVNMTTHLENFTQKQTKKFVRKLQISRNWNTLILARN